MNTSFAFGVAIGLMVVFAACAAVVKMVKLRNGKPAKYDERQQAARGKAFTVAYTTLLIYLAVWMILNGLEIPFFAMYTSVLVGVLISVAVFAGYSIFTDAYFRASDKPTSWIALIGAISLMNLGIGAWHAIKETTVQARWLENANLMVGIMCLIVLVCALIKRAMDRRIED